MHYTTSYHYLPTHGTYRRRWNSPPRTIPYLPMARTVGDGLHHRILKLGINLNNALLNKEHLVADHVFLENDLPAPRVEAEAAAAAAGGVGSEYLESFEAPLNLLLEYFIARVQTYRSDIKIKLASRHLSGELKHRRKFGCNPNRKRLILSVRQQRDLLIEPKREHTPTILRIGRWKMKV